MQLTLDTEKLGQGNVREWHRLFCDYEHMLLTQAYRIVRNAQDAEEVVQTVMMRMWMRKGKLPLIENVERYLVTSVRNQARNMVRPNTTRIMRVGFDKVLANEPASASADDPSSVAQERECLDTLEDVERMLTDVQRRVLAQLKNDPTLSSRSIAARLGCSHKNVLGILRRIRRALASHYFGN
ncbi:MAG: sigma-70 family RNA polymerase sigma factor [Hyphomicrobiales bacterium]|nr:sigma-70 family RNA polymerase sigma factor [Hyphomicrobiales bacterium]